MNETKTTYENLLQGILTEEDLLIFTDQLKQLQTQIFEVKEDYSLKKVISNILPYSKQVQLESLFEKNQIDTSNMVKIRDLLEDILKYLSTIPVCTLTLAFEPNEETLEKVLLTVTDQTRKTAVLSIKVDKKIIGGALIEWQGKYQDYSVKKKVQQYFSQEKKGEGHGV